MRILLSTIAGAALVLSVAVLGSGTALADEEVVTVTGQIVVAEEDAEGDVIVTIVTETDTYIVSNDSKAGDISPHSGKKVQAKGAVKVTEVGKTISPDEYALIEDETPPVAAED